MASYSECWHRISRMPGMRRYGREWKGPCPNCGGKDRFVLNQGSGDKLILFCRQCSSAGKTAHLYRALEDTGVIPRSCRVKPTSIPNGVDQSLVTYARALISMIDRACDLAEAKEIDFEYAWASLQPQPLTVDDALQVLKQAAWIVKKAQIFGEIRTPDQTHWDVAAIREKGRVSEANND